MADTRGVAQADLYLYNTVLDGVNHTIVIDPDTGEVISDDRVTSFEYGQSMNLILRGGSGTGDIHYDVVPVTGSGTITSITQLPSPVEFTFDSPGTVLVKAYKDSSTVDDVVYEQSKTLVIELTLIARRIWIRVNPSETNIDINESIPSHDDSRFFINIDGLQNGDSLGTDPEIYFTYESDDFYKQDLLNNANVTTDPVEINGITYQYLPEFNAWKLDGTATADSIYDLFASSSQYTPSGKYELSMEYELTSGDSKVPLQFYWAFDDGSSSKNIHTTDVYYVISPNVTYYSISFLVTAGTTVHNQIIECHFYSQLDRVMTSDVVSKYPLSARGGEPPNDPRYNPKIQYRSAWVNVNNTDKYHIYTWYEADMGIVNASSIEAYPFSTVVFTVEAFDGCYFDDSVSGSIRVYGASEMSPIVYTRFSDPIRDSSDRIISCTYEFVMPTGQANIRCDFLYVSTNDYNIGDNPYTDVGLWRDGSGSYVRFDGDNADDYVYALRYCYYVKKQSLTGVDPTVVPSPPVYSLISGVDTNQFYERYCLYDTANTVVQHYIRRKEAMKIVAHLSHVSIPTQRESLELIASNPDPYYMSWSASINTPLAHLYGYAGHTGIPGYNYSSTDGNPIEISKPGQPRHPDPYFPKIIYDSVYRLTDTYNSSYPELSIIGANDDYLVNTDMMCEVAWASWMGVVNGYTEHSVAGNSFMTFQDVAALFYRYAQFRHADITNVSEYSNIDDSSAAEWAKRGPLKWAMGRKLAHETTPLYRESVDGTNWTQHGGQPLQPDTLLDRAEFAYMLMRFCMLYNW